MQEYTADALDPRLGRQLAVAEQALKGGEIDYALLVGSQLSRRYPGWVAARRLLRSAQWRGVREKRGARAVCNRVRAIFLRLYTSSLASRDPVKAMERAELALAADPHNRAAHALLGAAARQLGWRETAVLACQSLRDLDPGNAAVQVQLGEALLEWGRLEEAAALAEDILRRRPEDAAAQALLQKASVEVSLHAAGWKESG